MEFRGVTIVSLGAFTPGVFRQLKLLNAESPPVVFHAVSL
jgi:hypothetical protein